AGSIKNFSLREGKRMENVMRYIMEHCHRHISLAEVAGVANMNKEAFCRFFKERTRKTVTQFVNEVRITRACSLLANQDLSISQVAAESGFPNLSYFNRVFRNIKKATPKEYRNAYLLETAQG
ncbi:MAG: helix-turn-helix domain-containing protein, partial [Bacteroidota bacterium]